MNYEHWLIKDGILFCPECRRIVRDNLYRKIFGYGPKEFVINSIIALIMIVKVIISIISGFILISIISVVLGPISLIQIIILFFRYFLRKLDNMMFLEKIPGGLPGLGIKNKRDQKSGKSVLISVLNHSYKSKQSHKKFIKLFPSLR